MTTSAAATASRAKPTDILYLTLILQRSERIRSYTVGGREQFFASEITQDAVALNLEAIGEATKQLSKKLRAQHPEVSWQQIAAVGDTLLHDFLGENLHAVWQVVAHDLDTLEAQVRRILASLDKTGVQSDDARDEHSEH